MAHVSRITNVKNINLACPDGFSNQLRLVLAGVFLKMNGYIDSFNVDWNLNNHCNVNFLDYFLPLPKITFQKINFSQISENEVIDTCSFKAMIETLSKKEHKIIPEEALQFALKFLIPRPEISDILNSYLSKYNIENSLGIHVRRTCKTAILKSDDAYRTKSSVLTNEELCNICTHHKQIFLATDNKETQKWFFKKIKNNIITFAQIDTGLELFEGEYNRSEVARYTTPLHTIMDFLILKNCHTFLGTSESSLSLLIYNWRNNKNDYPILGRL